MTAYFNDLYPKLESTYDAALLSGSLIFTASATHTTTETEHNIKVTPPSFLLAHPSHNYSRLLLPQRVHHLALKHLYLNPPLCLLSLKT